jgi:hypothetical protein
MTDFWRTFHHDGKISPGWSGWGVHAHPLSLCLPSRTKLQCTLQLRGQIFNLYPICTLWLAHRLYVTLSGYRRSKGCQQTQYLNIKLHCCGSPHLSTRVYDPHKTIQKFYNSRLPPPTPPHHRTPSHRVFQSDAIPLHKKQVQDTKIMTLPIEFRYLYYR